MNQDEEGTFIYRLPESGEIVFGRGRVLSGLLEGGFALAPFESRRENFLTIMRDRDGSLPIAEFFEGHPRSSCSSRSSRSSHSYRSRRFSQVTDSCPDIPPRWYMDGIRHIQRELSMAGGGKMVFSRVIERNPDESAFSRFEFLVDRYPSAFVFLFDTPQTGKWYGASPELLLKKDGETLETMSLAGTRPAGTDGDWDGKNLEEQRMVTDFILSAFRHAGLNPKEGLTVTQKAGPVEHIRTDISATLTAPTGMDELLEQLSPTPALCGSDREAALRILKEIEREPRRMYGGWCGPVFKDGFHLFVNLRCAEVLPDGTHLQHVGGGITLQSDPGAEWEETCRKAATLFPD